MTREAIHDWAVALWTTCHRVPRSQWVREMAGILLELERGKVEAARLQRKLEAARKRS